MYVFMLLKGRMPARRDLEIPKLACHVLCLAKEHLPGDAGEMGAIGFIREERHPVPAIPLMFIAKTSNDRHGVFVGKSL